MRYISSDRVEATRRPGVVLLVVMAMLSLFAALGIGFVFYADAVAVAANANRAAMAKEQADIDPELLAAHFLGELLYGTNNPYSSMLGHSLADTMWGYNPAVLNTTPYNGPGRQSYTVTQPNGSSADNFDMIHYMKFDSDLFQRRPGFHGVYTNTLADQYIEAPNVSWTAQDRQSMFLSSVTADGKVLLPSFVRPWIPMNVNQTTDLTKMDRYKTLRPHGSWHPGFVGLLPDSESILFGTNNAQMVLDVRNYDFGMGFQGQTGPTGTTTFWNNDSIWMDLGFPIMTAANGKRYRPLFAPLVVDLSNRLHLWVHGNNIGTGSSHVSSEGIGVSEVNLSVPVTPTSNKAVLNPADLANLFARRGTPPPGAPIPMPANGLWYSKIDFDAIDTTVNTGKSAPAFTYPTTTGAFPFTPFPSFAAGGYENDATSAGKEAAAGKPLGRNIAAAGQRPMVMSQMEWLLRQKGTNAPALTSELAKLLSNTLNDPTDTSSRKRNMVTLWSSHLDRVAAPPVIGFNPYDGTPRYTLATPAVGNPLPPVLSTTGSPIYPQPMPKNTEYTADWRSNLANQLRINLNRTLSRYPVPDPKTGLMVDAPPLTYKQAVLDRQAMARELYNALVRVTGAVDPNHPDAPKPLTAAIQTGGSYQAARWLAQLAVNIVDYIDEDDYMTPFPWSPDTNDVVFGTELPRLVMNEFYAQYDTEADGVQANCKLNVWLELHNPFTVSTDAFPRDQGTANLVQGVGSAAPMPIYQIVVCNKDLSGVKLRAPQNNLGVLDDPSLNPVTIADWGTTAATQQVTPGNGNFSGTTLGSSTATGGSNNGFYVLGPAATFLNPKRNPNFPTTYLAPGLSIQTPHPMGGGVQITVLLRRLANPHMRVNTDTGDPAYNPFITVDYLENVLAYDNRENFKDGMPTGFPLPVPAQNVTTGRPHPYAANGSLLVGQLPAPATATQPAHTFFRHNSKATSPPVPLNDPTLYFPFDWLAHLDRPLINPLELLHVSGYRPHELTQQFITINPKDGTLIKSSHYAPWNNALPWTNPGVTTGPNAQTSMIYRLLEMVTTPNHLAGTYNGGSHQGRLNINTITEEEIMQAWADANNANFSTTDVQNTFNSIVASRTGASTFNLQPTSDGTPFRGFAATNWSETLLRPISTSAPNRVFDVGAATDHPYKRNSLLQKIFNNHTTTSNVFAVWWTVGYFEVDETVRPAKLGAEIGRAENHQIRHRFFAIVDRSAMEVYSATTTSAVSVLAPDAVTGLIADQSMSIDPTSILTITGRPTTWSPTQRYSISNAVAYGAANAPYICIKPNTGIDPSADPNASLYWQAALQKGMILEVAGAAGVTGETVVVKSVTSPTTFTANFTAAHPIGARLRLRGHPGPQSVYNPHRDGNVVLHMSVIK